MKAALFAALLAVSTVVFGASQSVPNELIYSDGKNLTIRITRDACTAPAVVSLLTRAKQLDPTFPGVEEFVSSPVVWMGKPLEACAIGTVQGGVPVMFIVDETGDTGVIPVGVFQNINLHTF